MFLNGLPVAVIELKDPTDTQADLGDGHRPARPLHADRARPVRAEPAAGRSRDGMLTRVGSITSGRSRFMPWRPWRRRAAQPTLEALIRGLFEPRGAAGLPAHLRHLRGGRARRDRQEDRGLSPVPRRAQGAGERAGAPEAAGGTTDDGPAGGVIWHTQGSGKSLTMLMLAGALIREPRDGQPDHGHGHRPQRSGRPAFRHLRRRAGAAAAGPGAGRKPGAPEGAARPRGGRRGVHHHPEVRRGARRDLASAPTWS